VPAPSALRQVRPIRAPQQVHALALAFLQSFPDPPAASPEVAMSRIVAIAALLAFASPAFAQSRGTAVPNPMQSGAPAATAPTRMAAPTSRTPASSANQFASEPLAQAHCAGDSVVWVNLRSKAYHLKGTQYYGHTKSGAYMCQKDATAGGMHATQGEKPNGSAVGH